MVSSSKRPSHPTRTRETDRGRKKQMRKMISTQYETEKQRQNNDNNPHYSPSTHTDADLTPLHPQVHGLSPAQCRQTRQVDAKSLLSISFQSPIPPLFLQGLLAGESIEDAVIAEDVVISNDIVVDLPLDVLHLS